nr:hypothetical protein [uncultured Draconibacterium sp.]
MAELHTYFGGAPDAEFSINEAAESPDFVFNKEGNELKTGKGQVSFVLHHASVLCKWRCLLLHCFSW